MKAASRWGPEVAFVGGIHTEEDARRIVQELDPMPCLLNLATNGNTPNWTVKEAQEMGFSDLPLRRYDSRRPCFAESYNEIMETGTDIRSCRGSGPKGFFEVVGLNNAIAIDQKAEGIAYSKV